MPWSRGTSLLVLLAGLLFPSWCEAAKSLQPIPLDLPGVKSIPVVAGVDTPSCRLGALPPERDLLNFIFPPESYYTRLVASDCSECASADTIRFTTAHLRIYFQRRCPFPVRVWVAGATGPDTCAVPDPSNRICPPASFTLDPGTDTLTVLDFALTLPAPCDVDVTIERPFLVIEFPLRVAACDAPETKPLLVLNNRPCTRCTAYNDWDFDGFENDMCDPVDVIGHLIMYADIDTCFPPPFVGAPATVRDLRSVGANDSTVSLRWTATGDTGTVGRPASYRVHAATEPLSPALFDTAPLQHEIPGTVDAGGIETHQFGGLVSGRRYWFAVKARSSQGTLSSISNVISVATGPGPPLSGKAGVAVVSRAQPARLPVELMWRGSGNASPQEIRIYDAFGSELRLLRLDPEPTGVATWDGKDKDGRLVRPGVYFARFRSGTVIASCRIALLR